MEYYSIHKFAKLVGRVPETLRNWERTGRLIPHHRGPNGYRYYSSQQLNEVLGIDSPPKTVVGYCRVSSRKQKDDLERQVQNMREYLTSLGGDFEIIQDVGSGVNYKNKGLQSLIDRIIKQEVGKVVVFYKDRLLRFGFELVEYVAKLSGCEIVVLNSVDKSEQEELVEDLVQIITVFSCRLQGKRAKKAKKLIDELSADCMVK